MSQTPRYKVIVLELIPGDVTADRNDIAIAAVEKEILEATYELMGIEVVPESVIDRDPPLIDPLAVRDHEAEARISDRVEGDLAELVAQTTTHLRAAGVKGAEAARLAAVVLYAKTQNQITVAIERVFSLWETYGVTTPQITKGLIGCIIWAAVKEAVKLAS